MPAQQKKSNQSKKNEQKNKSASKKDDKNDKNNKNDKSDKNDSSSDSKSKPAKKGDSYPPETAPVKQRIPPKYDAEKRQKEKEKEKEEKEKEQQEEEEEEEEEGSKKKGKKCDLKKKEKKAMEDEIKRLLNKNTKEDKALDEITNKSNKNKVQQQATECRMPPDTCEDSDMPKFNTEGEDLNSLKPMGIGRNIHLQDSVTHDMKLNLPEPSPPPSQDPITTLIDENYLPIELRNEIEKKRKEAKRVRVYIVYLFD